MPKKPDSAHEETTVVEAEASTSADSRPPVTGQRLIELVQQHLAKLRLPERAAAEAVGVTTIYWAALTNGHRKLSALPREKMQRLADFVGISVVQAYMLADLFSPADFVVQTDLAADLNASLQKMRADKNWRGVAPDDETWATTPLKSQLAIVLLFEKVSNRRLLLRAQLGHGVRVGPDPSPDFTLEF